MERREDLSAGGLELLLSMGLPCLGAGLALALLTVPSSWALSVTGREQSG